MAWASIVLGAMGVAGLTGIIVLDGAGIPHGAATDAILTTAWLAGGLLALIAGRIASSSTPGKLGLALGIVAGPLGLVAFLIFALTQV